MIDKVLELLKFILKVLTGLCASLLIMLLVKFIIRYLDWTYTIYGITPMNALLHILVMCGLFLVVVLSYIDITRKFNQAWILEGSWLWRLRWLVMRVTGFTPEKTRDLLSRFGRYSTLDLGIFVCTLTIPCAWFWACHKSYDLRLDRESLGFFFALAGLFDVWLVFKVKRISKYVKGASPLVFLWVSIILVYYELLFLNMPVFSDILSNDYLWFMISFLLSYLANSCPVGFTYGHPAVFPGVLQFILIIIGRTNSYYNLFLIIFFLAAMAVLWTAFMSSIKDYRKGNCDLQLVWTLLCLIVVYMFIFISLDVGYVLTLALDIVREI